MTAIVVFSLISLVSGLIVGGVVGFNVFARLMAHQLNDVMNGEDDDQTRRLAELMKKALSHEKWWRD